MVDSYTAVSYLSDGAAYDSQTYSDMDEAIFYADLFGYDEVIDDLTGEVVWVNMYN